MNTTTAKMLRELESRGKELPTPVYIIHQPTLEENIDELYRAFNSRFKRFIFAYSYKTNYATDILHTVHRKGGYAEVVSPMELHHALNQVSVEQIIYNGVIPDASAKCELAKAGSMVNVENLTELKAINEYANSTCRKGQIVNVGIRVNLTLDGTAPSRFGVEVNDETLTEIAKLRNVRVVGIHCHVTKSRDLALWREKAEQMAVIAKSPDCGASGEVAYSAECIRIWPRSSTATSPHFRITPTVSTMYSAGIFNRMICRRLLWRQVRRLSLTRNRS